MSAHGFTEVNRQLAQALLVLQGLAVLAIGVLLWPLLFLVIEADGAGHAGEVLVGTLLGLPTLSFFEAWLLRHRARGPVVALGIVLELGWLGVLAQPGTAAGSPLWLAFAGVAAVVLALLPVAWDGWFTGAQATR